MVPRTCFGTKRAQVAITFKNHWVTKMKWRNHMQELLQLFSGHMPNYIVSSGSCGKTVYCWHLQQSALIIRCNYTLTHQYLHSTSLVTTWDFTWLIVSCLCSLVIIRVTDGAGRAYSAGFGELWQCHFVCSLFSAAVLVQICLVIKWLLNISTDCHFVFNCTEWIIIILLHKRIDQPNKWRKNQASY